MRPIVCGPLCLVLVTGCAVLGRQQKDNPISAENVARVEKGMSQEDVGLHLGAPQEILFMHREHDPERVYAYIYQQTTTAYTAVAFGFINFGNVDAKGDKVVVFFDDVGKVAHVARSLYGDQASFGFPFGK